MHILHIFNSYGGTAVYYNLLVEIDKLGIKQTVFVPLNPKNHNRKGNFNVDFTVKDSRIIYSTELKKRHRYLYFSKIHTITNAIQNLIALSDVSLINAGMLCVDGAVAFELSKKYNIPFITSVRNTDINTYYQKLVFKRNYFAKILLNAKKIIFISPQYQYKVLNKIISPKLKKLIEHKTITIPNGIKSIFLERRKEKPNTIHSPVRILYAGAFQRGKNIERIIEALALLEKKGTKIEFTGVGKGLLYRNNSPKYIKEIENLAAKYSWIKLMDSVDQNELLKLMRENDIFAMPSVPETFGLVYVEALSQGLPIIYAKGEGFDGYYSEGEIGFGVDSSNINDIANKLDLIINSYNDFANRITANSLDRFSWTEIGYRYYQIFNEVKKYKS